MPWPHASLRSTVSETQPSGLYGPNQPATVTDLTGAPATIYSDQNRTLTLSTSGATSTDGIGDLWYWTEPGVYQEKVGLTTSLVLVNPWPPDILAMAGYPLATVTPWQPSTVYVAGQLVTFAGSTYAAKTNFTSGASFNAANWNVIAAGSSTALSYSTTVPAGTTTGASVIGTDTTGVPHPDHQHTLGAHASTHNSGGTDAVTLAESQVTNLVADLAAKLPLAGGTMTGSLDIGTAGQGLKVAEGANAKQGRATLVAGSATVANTSVTAGSEIFLTTQIPGGTIGMQYVSARTAGTSFTITSTSPADTSTVGYFISEPG